MRGILISGLCAIILVGCGGDNSTPTKGPVFDMVGDYDLSDYMFLNKAGNVVYKEITEVDSSGKRNYENSVPFVLFPVFKYTKDGSNVASIKKLLSIPSQSSDFDIEGTKIIEDRKESDNHFSIEWARHSDIGDVVADSTADMASENILGGTTTKHISCKIADAGLSQEVLDVRYEDVLVLSCDIDNKTVYTKNGAKVTQKEKGTQVLTYSKGNALIKSVLDTCVSIALISNRCTKITLEKKSN